MRTSGQVQVLPTKPVALQNTAVTSSAQHWMDRASQAESDGY